MKSKLILIVICTLFPFSGFAENQKMVAPPTPQFIPFLGQTSLKESIRQSIEMKKELFKIRLELMSEPETAKLMAEFSRSYYEALLSEGFTALEAMQLIISVGVPRI